MKKFCPHCCNNSKLEKIHTQSYRSLGWYTETMEEENFHCTYYIFKCTVCNQILLYDQFENDELTLVFPSTKIDSSVPENVSKIYEEAIRIKNIAPNAFAVQIRRALEAVCIDRGSNKKGLFKQLEELGEKGEIPETLSKASDILRLIGNLGAHAGDDDVHVSQVYAIDDFFKAIIEYVYVSPSKIEKFKKTLSKANS